MIYAPHGSPQFQREFASTMREVGHTTAAALGDNLASLWLGGGFGRGEGAVTHVSGAERAYNDVDLFLYVYHPEEVDHEVLKGLEEAFTEELGAHLEYSKPLPVRTLGRMQPALMWFDALRGHKVIAGAKDIHDRFPHAVHDLVPAFEGPRLLLNRGAGLVWALRVVRGLEQAPDPDFVRRNLWKARLALIEASLIVSHRYVFGLEAKRGSFAKLLAEREAGVPAKSGGGILTKMPGFRSPLLSEEAAGDAFTFKINPDRFPDLGSPETIAGEWEAAFREIEEMRFRRSFTTPEYAAFLGHREPASRTRNLLRNAKKGKISFTHPREGLYRKLPGLLTSHGSDWDVRSAAFLDAWRRHC